MPRHVNAPGHTRAAHAAAVALALSMVIAGPGPGAVAATHAAPAAQPGQRGTPWLHRLIHGARFGVRLDGRPVGGRTETELRSLLVDIARRGDRPARDATLDHATGTVVSDRAGIRLDAPATLRATLAARPYGHVRTIWRPVQPRWRYEDIARLTNTIGTYTTWISGSVERRRNIVLSSRAIDNRVVYPGQVFSFVGTVGRISKKLGYKAAPTIQDGEMRPGLGGGICQVSSTLYNAVRRAGLAIVERHHHALAVHYVPAGRDATVVMPSDPPSPGVPILDLRFRNALDHPVALQAVVHGWKLTVWVQGPGPVTPSTRPPKAATPALA